MILLIRLDYSNDININLNTNLFKIFSTEFKMGKKRSLGVNILYNIIDLINIYLKSYFVFPNLLLFPNILIYI